MKYLTKRRTEHFCRNLETVQKEIKELKEKELKIKTELIKGIPHGKKMVVGKYSLIISSSKSSYVSVTDLRKALGKVAARKFITIKKVRTFKFQILENQ